MKRISFIIFCILMCLLTQAQNNIITRFKSCRYDANNNYKVITSSISFSRENNGIGRIYLFPSYSDESVKSFCFWTTGSREPGIVEMKSMLINIKEKYVKWTQVAKDNHIINYSKKLEGKDIYIPNFQGILEYKNRQWWAPEWSLHIVPYFIVDENGNCLIKLNCPPSTFQAVKNFDNALQGMIYMGAGEGFDSLKSCDAYYLFSSPEQIQSMIEALDFDKACKEVDAQKKQENDRKSKLDELFN